MYLEVGISWESTVNWALVPCKYNGELSWFVCVMRPTLITFGVHVPCIHKYGSIRYYKLALEQKYPLTILGILIEVFGI